MERKAHITTKQQLLTACWTAEVHELEKAVGEFSTHRQVTNDCGVTFFEMAGDRELHVNVCHRHRTVSAKGWAGPGNTAEGFVHNRRFSAVAPQLIVRHLRAMVFAPRA